MLTNQVCFYSTSFHTWRVCLSHHTHGVLYTLMQNGLRTPNLVCFYSTSCHTQYVYSTPGVATVSRMPDTGVLYGVCCTLDVGVLTAHYMHEYYEENSQTYHHPSSPHNSIKKQRASTDTCLLTNAHVHMHPVFCVNTWCARIPGC